MGRVIPMIGGNNAYSDELTANKEHVLTGHTAITHDSDGDPIEGTMPSRGIYTAQPNVDDIGKDNTGLYSRIPYGYYGQRGAKAGYSYNYLNDSALAAAIGLTSSHLKSGANILGVEGDAWTVWTGEATAEPQHVLSGKTYWKQGTKQAGSLTIQSVVSFKVAQYSNLTLIASWARPAKGPWSGLRILCKQGGYPANVNDGMLLYEGSATSATKQLAAGTWYFRAWNYITTNSGRLYGGYSQVSTNNITVAGQQVFTQSGIFTVPAYVRQIQVFVVGGGGAGGSDESNSGGGGGAGYTNHGTFAVIPGQEYGVTIGAGGAQTYGNRNPGSPTSFGSLITANGGEGGGSPNGGTGGSGGGQRGIGGGNSTEWAGKGGSDGSSGYLMGHSSPPPTGAGGQGRTTRAFGESTGTLYAGGGGGASAERDGGNAGGEGGGGDGAYHNGTSVPVAGAPNTGGGGGAARYRGADDSWSSTRIGAAGGSGICIVRW